MSETNRLNFDPIPVVATSRPELPKVPDLPPIPQVKPPSILPASTRPAAIVTTPEPTSSPVSTPAPSDSSNWFWELVAPTHSKGVIALGLLSLVAGAATVRYIWPPKPLPTPPDNAKKANGLPAEVPPEMVIPTLKIPDAEVPTVPTPRLEVKTEAKNFDFGLPNLPAPGLSDTKPTDIGSNPPAPKLTQDLPKFDIPFPTGIALAGNTEPVPAPKPNPPAPEKVEPKPTPTTPIPLPTPTVEVPSLALPMAGGTPGTPAPAITAPSLQGDKKPAPVPAPAPTIALPSLETDKKPTPPPSMSIELPKTIETKPDPSKLPELKLDLQPPPPPAIPSVVTAPKMAEMKPMELPGSGGIALPGAPAAPKPEIAPSAPKLDITPAPLKIEPAPVAVKPEPPASPKIEPVGGVPDMKFNLAPAPALESPVVAPMSTVPQPAPLATNARTDYDVDLHYVKNGDSWASVSKQHFGDERYGEALKGYNRSMALTQLQRAEIPPLHVLRAGFSSVIGSPTPKPTEWSNISTVSPTTTPKPIAVVEGTIARVTSGGPKTYIIPQGGRTLRQVALDAYGDEDRWGKVWDSNPNVSPKAVIPEGTKLTLTADSRIGN